MSGVSRGTLISTRPATSPTNRSQLWARRIVLGVSLLLSSITLLLRFGGDFLVTRDQMPAHAQVAVMLDGPTQGVISRNAAALSLLQQGRVDHIMLSVGRVSLWGEWVPDMVASYVKRTYGTDTAMRVVLCEMNTDSTLEEAVALRGCLLERGWTSIIVVTSEYHTRRARRIWRKTLGSSSTVCVYGVRDADFERQGWWRSRHYAKTWLLETTKLTWSYLWGT
jgi:uncharacterized SAM-binding protein YcdF (DUF218 family)